MLALSDRPSSVLPFSVTFLHFLYPPALLCSVLFGILKLYSTMQFIVVMCKLVFSLFSILLNDLNILSTFDKVAEVYRLNFWSFCFEGLLAMSNDTANLQLLQPETCCSNARNHSPAQVEALLSGCIFSICFCSKCQHKAEKGGGGNGLH